MTRAPLTMYTLDDYKSDILDPMVATVTVTVDVLYGMWPPWPNCSVPGCAAKTCLALDSNECFAHTPGNAWVKRRRIEWRRAKRFWQYELPNRVAGAWKVLRGKAEAREDDYD